MIGRMVWTGAPGFGIRLEEERLLGLPVLRAELPGGPEGRWSGRRWKKGLRLLEQAGSRRILVPGEDVENLAWGLRPVLTRPLWQQMAAPLALSALERAGARPERAVVGIRGRRVSNPLFRACCGLMRTVRAISLDAPEGGEELAWWLEREYGVPVLREGGDVTLCFSQEEERADYFLLGEPQPCPKGFTVALRKGELPENCPALPLLSALVEEGRVAPENLQVIPIGPVVDKLAGTFP